MIFFSLLLFTVLHFNTLPTRFSPEDDKIIKGNPVLFLCLQQEIRGNCKTQMAQPVLPSQIVVSLYKSNFVEVNGEKEEEFPHKKCFKIYITRRAHDPVLKHQRKYHNCVKNNSEKAISKVIMIKLGSKYQYSYHRTCIYNVPSFI